MAGVQTAVALREQGFTWGAFDADRRRTSTSPTTGPRCPRPSCSASPRGLRSCRRRLRGLPRHRTPAGLRWCPRPAPRRARAGHRGRARPLYDVLVIATGAEPTVRLPGAEGVPGVHVLRTLDDAERLRPRAPARSARSSWSAPAGSARSSPRRPARPGCAVTVVEAADRPLAGALPAEVDRADGRWYAEAGVGCAPATPSPRSRRAVVLRRRPAARRRGRRRHRRPARHGWLAGSGVVLGAQRRGRADDRLRPAARRRTPSATAPPSPRPATASGCWHTLGQRAAGPPRPSRPRTWHGAPRRLRPGALLLVRAVRPFVQYAADHDGADTVRRGDPAPAGCAGPRRLAARRPAGWPAC